MNLRKSYCLTSWILAVTLSLSPAMAQNSPAPAEESTAQAVQAEAIATAPEFQDVEKDSVSVKPLSAPNRAPKNGEISPPGKSKWLILAAIVTTVAVVAAILLWPDGGDKVKRPEPVGTVITAGTPNVGTPNQ